jgi:hypothetical protein
VADWSFLTNHARVLLCIAHDPGVRLRDIAARTGVTERTAYGIVDTPGSPARPLPSGVSRSTSGKIGTSSTSPRPLSRASTWPGQDRSARASLAAYRPAKAVCPATPPAASTRFHGIAALQHDRRQSPCASLRHHR